MEILYFDPGVSREITQYGIQNLLLAKIARLEGEAHIHCMHLGSKGTVGYHQEVAASFSWLFKGRAGCTDRRKNASRFTPARVHSGGPVNGTPSEAKPDDCNRDQGGTGTLVERLAIHMKYPLLSRLSQARHRNIIPVFIVAVLLSACRAPVPPEEANPTQTIVNSAPTITPVVVPLPLIVVADQANYYPFPQAIDPEARYLIYLHGRIIEDEGPEAVSPEFGPYEFHATLEYLAAAGSMVIAEVRAPNTDADAYARRVVEQVNTLIERNVPPENITVVGFSKGGAIAIVTSASSTTHGESSPCWRSAGIGSTRIAP